MKLAERILGGFIRRLEETKVSFWGIVFLLYGVFFIRTFLENFANSGNFYHMSGFVDTFFHYPIFFSIIVLISIIIATILARVEITKAAKFVVLCSGGLLVPPILDLILNRGGQIPYVFISGSYKELLHSFATFLGGGAIGTGLRVEAALAILGLGIYIFLKAKNVVRMLVGMFIFYSAVFLFLATPAVIFIAHNGITQEYGSVNSRNIARFFFEEEPAAALTYNRTFILESGDFPPPAFRRIQNQFSITLSIVFLAVHALLFFWCLFLYSKEKFRAVRGNFRYARIFHNSVLILLGIFLSMGISGRFPIASLFDLLSFISLFLAFIFAWLFAVWENDEADIAIDRISNKSRPLAGQQAIFSAEEWRIFKYVFLAYSLAFALLCGLYTLVFILLFIFVYHIYQVYSIPATRLKKFPIVSSVAIAVNSLLLVWMGFFLGAGTEYLNLFPKRFTFGILLIFLLVENAKNIKDIEGDRSEGIRTLPVVLGEKWGKRVVGACLFLGAILVPIVFHLNLVSFAGSVACGAVLFVLANRKNYEERYLFATYFTYVCFVIISEFLI